MKWFWLAWAGSGVLGMTIDLIRHRKDVRAEIEAGGYWTVTEIGFLILAMCILGPGLIVLPLFKKAS